MSEQKPSYMQQLDEWTQKTLLDPLYKAWELVESVPDEYAEDAQNDLLAAVGEVKKAIREKVLQSYRNGQKAGPRKEWTAKNKQEK